MSNEQIFSDYINEMVEKTDNCALNSDWTLWMLRTIRDSNERGFVLNPDWLRASYKTLDDPEPVMFCELAIYPACDESNS